MAEESVCDEITVPLNASFQLHEAVGIFPVMGDVDYLKLKADIRKFGLRAPIVVHKNKIIDGRHRLRACEELGVAPQFVAVTDLKESVESYVTSMNLHRRHLTDSQRALVAARLAPSVLGANQHTACAVTQAQAAARLNVSIDSVQRARSVISHGVHELVEAVYAGSLDVTNASAIAALPATDQALLLAMPKKAIFEKAKMLRKEQMSERRLLRLAAIEAKRQGNRPLDFKGEKFEVIYADPPWDYLAESALGYPTMTLANICTLGVEKICADDAVLFLWCSASLVGDAIDVIKSWGFTYKTQAIWDKGCPGQGQYFRLQHEVLMLATRGKLPEVQFDARVASVVQAARGLHSQKPAIFIDLIEAMYPELKKVELFRRGETLDGWAGWGNECISPKPANLIAQEHSHTLREAANDDIEFETLQVQQAA